MADVTLDGVRIRVYIDEHPQLDYLGEYTNEPGPDDRTIDRQARGDQGRGEHRYFVAPRWTEKWEHVEQNYERMESYGAGWLCLGLRAVADLTVHLDNGKTLTTSVESGGIWGVESDSDEAIEQWSKEEFAEVRSELEELGVDTPANIWADFTGDYPVGDSVLV